MSHCFLCVKNPVTWLLSSLQSCQASASLTLRIILVNVSSRLSRGKRGTLSWLYSLWSPYSTYFQAFVLSNSPLNLMAKPLSVRPIFSCRTHKKKDWKSWQWLHHQQKSFLYHFLLANDSFFKQVTFQFGNPPKSSNILRFPHINSRSFHLHIPCCRLFLLTLSYDIFSCLNNCTNYQKTIIIRKEEIKVMKDT